jgi:hypothetical protein
MALDATDAAYADYIASKGAMQGPPPVGQVDPTDTAYAAYQASKNTKGAPADVPNWIDAALIGAGRFVDKSAYGLRSGVQSLLGDNVVNAIDKLGTTLGMAPSTSLTPQAQAQNEGIYSNLQQQQPVATFLGEMAPSFAAGTPVLQGLLAALQPGSAADRAKAAAFGYGGMKLGDLAGSALGRLFGPASMDAATAANQYGIPQTVGQTTNFLKKPAQVTESVLQNLPFSAGVMSNASDATYGAFNRAVSNTFGADSTKLTPQVLGTAKDTIGPQIGDIADRNVLKVTPTFAQSIADWSTWAPNNIAGDSLTLFNKKLDQIVNAIGPSGDIPGTLYHSMDGVLGRMANSGTDSDLRFGAAGLRQTMRDGFDASISPADADAWSTLRRQYQNVQIVANAAKGSPEGTISPSQLLTQVNKAQKNAKFGAGNDLAKLAQWAQPNIGDSIPNSGSIQRSFYQNLITNPLSTAAGIGGGLYGLNEMKEKGFGIGPADALLAPLIMYGAARGLAGAPASAFTRNLLERSGQTLGQLATFSRGAGAGEGVAGPPLPIFGPVPGQ